MLYLTTSQDDEYMDASEPKDLRGFSLSHEK